VAGLEQHRHEPTTDVAGRAGNEDVHLAPEVGVGQTQQSR
jgi:hypothetical protein